MPRQRRATTASGKALTRPPSTFERLSPKTIELPRGAFCYRIYSYRLHNTRALTFRNYGPLGRFDHQRPSADCQPRLDKKRGVLYAALELTCCVAEVFSDVGEITLSGYSLARLKVTRTLELLDLRGRAAIKAGTISAISGVGERQTTQAYARWWYEHPQLQTIDGVIYPSAHTGDDTVGLWERAKPKIQNDKEWKLTDPSIRPDLTIIASELELSIG